MEAKESIKPACIFGQGKGRYIKILGVRLVNCNSNYIGIRIDITRNAKCCNVMLIIIHLFGNNTIIVTEDNRLKAF